jgi:nucleoside 2-deoxyribosyltransferase
MKIYVASSWRNQKQPTVVDSLRSAGHEVYDFRNPSPGDHGFHWSEIDPNWKEWSRDAFRRGLTHELAVAGFAADFNAMQWADVGILVMPCGRSAHLELGYFVGAGKPTIVLLDDGEPELMYRMATALCIDLQEAVDLLAVWAAGSKRFAPCTACTM